MASIDSVVSVQITAETNFPTVRDFNTVAILSEHTRFAEAFRVYENPTAASDMLTDGFLITDFAYKAVDLLFKQAVKPTRVVVARKALEQSYTQAINGLIDATNAWKYLIADTTTNLEILEIAGVVENTDKHYAVSSNSADVLSNATDNILAQLEALNYNRTIFFWHSSAGSDVPEAALLGRFAPEPVGSITWRMKGLVGIVADKLTATQENNLKLNNGIYYSTIEGLDVVLGDAVVVNGEYIDVSIGIDWLKARLQEQIFGTLVNNRKLNMDNAGAAKVEGDVRTVLNEAILRNILASSPAPLIKVPNVLSLTPAQRNTRRLPNVEFRARLAGAIHSVDIIGSVYP